MENMAMKALLERRSCRKFKPDAVPDGLLDQISAAGLNAASGRNRQPAIIIQTRNKAIRDTLSKLNADIMGVDSDPFYGAPVVLVVLVNKNHPTWQYDGPIVMENMMLAAHSLGLGSIWIHRAKEEFEQDEWKQFLADLGVEGDYEGVGHCVVGYAAYADDEYPEAAKRKDGRVFWVE